MFEGQYATDPNIATRAKYLDDMQNIQETSGYLTSPIFHAGLSKWDPTSDYQTKAEETVGGDIRGANVLNTGIGTLTPEPGEYPYPDYFPTDWGQEFGHEASHGGWDYANEYAQYGSEVGNPFKKYIDMATGEYEGGEEEMLTRMHDYMYGNLGNSLTGRWTGNNPNIYGPSSFLGRNKFLSSNQRTADWTPDAYKAIKNSNIADWQKGVMSLGPTTSRGQIALGQRPDQVRAQGQAYIDPDRGNVQAPTMTSNQIRQEADRTGGTRHAGEMTQAAAREAPQPRGNAGYSNVRQYGRARGGIASLWRR